MPVPGSRKRSGRIKRRSVRRCLSLPFRRFWTLLAHAPYQWPQPAVWTTKPDPWWWRSPYRVPRSLDCRYGDRPRRPRRPARLSLSLGGVLTAILLLPIPLYGAITWSSGSWSILQTSGGALSLSATNIPGESGFDLAGIGNGSGGASFVVRRSFTGSGSLTVSEQNLGGTSWGNAGGSLVVKTANGVVFDSQSFPNGGGNNQFPLDNSATKSVSNSQMQVVFTFNGNWQSQSTTPYRLSVSP